MHNLSDYITQGVSGIKRKKTVNFDALDDSIDSMCYKDFLKSISNLKPSSISNYKKALSYLYRYLEERALKFSNLNLFHLTRIFDGHSLKHETIYGLKTRIKSFLRWLYSMEYTEQDLSILMPKEKLVIDEKLPTTFTNKEVKAILKSIDRGTPIGRRNYAIILCIASYGWRCCDICNLKLKDFNWEEQSVTFIQQKTGVPLEVKLESSVFDSIVQYIVNGRPNDPEYDERNNGEVFLSLFKRKIGSPLKRESVKGILYKYLKRAGIKDLGNRKHGPHALRFSLATRMIENGTDIRVVKDVLGHKDKSVTFNYVRLDIAGLKKCNLKMQPCQSPFYSELEGNQHD